MKRYALLIIIIGLLVLTSCDRYKHSFAPAEETDFQAALFSPLTAAFQAITPSNLTPVLNFYAADYMHNGQYKADREAWFQNVLNQNTIDHITVTLMQNELINDSLAVANWRVRFITDTDQTVADSTFVGERLIKRGRSWLLYGNGDECGCNPVINQRAILEYFTFKTCPNCPVVEALLHNLSLTYPNSMTYLEYHLNDPMAIQSNYNVFLYYNLSNMPVTVFQGKTIINGNNDDNPAVFNSLIQDISSQPAKIGMTELQYAAVGNNLSGSVRLEIKDQTVTMEQMKLKYVIIDKESATHNNAAGEPCRNVVLASGNIALDTATLANPIQFSLNYTGTLPDDAYLVIWTQTMPTDYNYDATIHQALEAHITTAKAKYGK